MLPYLNVSKICGYDINGECGYTYYFMNNRNQKYLMGTKVYKFVLSDGSFIMSRLHKETETVNGIDIPATYLRVEIDINGNKAPNVIGKDLFKFKYYINYDKTPAGERNLSGTFVPSGGLNLTREEYKSEGCSKEGTGDNCAALIMADGWQIKDDYPW